MEADPRHCNEDAVSGAAELTGPPTWSGETPRLRGVLHEFAFFAALAAGIVLVALVSDARAQVASCLYAATLAAMFGASALYHRVRWSSASVRVWIRWLDRSAIFLFIAGTYTPFALLAFHGALATTLLALVWVGAAAGLLLNFAWVDAPTWLAALVYLALGWVGVVALPELFSSVGLAVSVLVLVGGGLYTLGALAYVLGRPDPAPAVFGYHEVFHLLVIAAAAVQYIAVSFVVLGAA
ncbi:MAG: PAQR family membrane homeostasis protein TrhA [Gaiellaceae bacterium]